MAYIRGTVTQQFSHPAWAKDYGSREHVVAGGTKIDPIQFPRDDSVAVQLNGAVTAGATSLTVDALAGPVPAGTILRFNNGVTVVTTALAAAAATAITVDAVPFGIPDNAQSVYLGTGTVRIPDGTVIGRTYTERDASTPFGPAADADTTTGEVYVLYHTVDDALQNNDADIYRHGGMIDEAHFPGWSGLSATIKAYLRANYQCMRGAD